METHRIDAKFVQIAVGSSLQAGGDALYPIALDEDGHVWFLDNEPAFGPRAGGTYWRPYPTERQLKKYDR